MEHYDLALSLLKLYVNYLEIVSFNIESAKKKRAMRRVTIEKDPLEYETEPSESVSSEYYKKNKNFALLYKRHSNKIYRKNSSPYVKNRNTLKVKPLKKDEQTQNTVKNKDSLIETDCGISEGQALLLGVKKNVKQREKRRFWVSEKYLSRNESGYFATSFKKLKTENPEEFFELTRMDLPTYNRLLSLLKDSLTKTSIRTPIEPECRLAVFLIYLSQGTPFEKISEIFQLGKSTAREIILDTSNVVEKILASEYLSQPSNDEYEEISNGFLEKYNIPNCIGAFDSKILNILLPCRGKKSLEGINRDKLAYTIVSNADNTLQWIDIKSYATGEELEFFEGTNLNIPDIEKPLPNSNIKFPYYFVGDESYPLKKHLICPFPPFYDTLVNDKEIILNKYLSKVHSVAENTIGILLSRWAVLQIHFKSNPQNCKHFLRAVSILHNFIMRNSKSDENRYCPPDYVDSIDEFGEIHPGGWRKELTRKYDKPRIKASDEYSSQPYILRDTLANYLMERDNLNDKE